MPGLMSHLYFTLKMITIEAWRSSIGAYNGFKIRSANKINKAKNMANAATLTSSALVVTALSAKLIGILLMIGCVEANPGPIGSTNEGKKYNILCVSYSKIFLE